ncbi:MAG: carnitine monooxygenase subunit YeaW [Rubricoccaceae bacterium]
MPASAFPDVSPETLRIDPLERADTIPSSWYTDARIEPLERAAVFRPSWQVVGHVSQMPRAGDTLCATVAGEPIVVVRGADDELRAFYNVCRHRGGPLVMEHQDSCRVLQCKYHGWTYLLDGSLRGVPRFDRTELFDKEENGLVPVTVDVWEGLVWVCTDANAASWLAPTSGSLDATLGGIAERIAPQDLSGLQFHSRVTYDVACNWKTYVDNYLEGYHLPLVHPELCKTLDVSAYVTETFDRTSLQHSPIRQRDDGSVYGEGDAFYWFVFPNGMLNILPGRLQTNVILPNGPDRCTVMFDFFYDDVTSPEALRQIDADLEFSERVQQEDIEICERVQLGLASRGYDRGRFSVECEAGVHHFQALLKTAFSDALDQGIELATGVDGLRPTPARSSPSTSRFLNEP